MLAKAKNRTVQPMRPKIIEPFGYFFYGVIVGALALAGYITGFLYIASKIMGH